MRSSEPTNRISYAAPFKIMSDLTPTFKKKGIEGAFFVLGVDNWKGKDSFSQPLRVISSSISTKCAEQRYEEIEINSYQEDGLSNIFPKLYDFVKRIKPDIILASTPLFAEIFALRELRQKIDIPMVNYCGSTPVKRKISNGTEVSGFELLKENKDVFERHIAISECTKKYLAKLGIEAEVIYAGVNPEQYDRLRNQAGPVGGNKKIVMYSGRFHIDKGVDLIPDIVERVLKKDNQVQFIIAGYGPWYPKLSQELKSFKGNVLLKTLGSNQLKGAYRKTHTYFKPSRKNEAFCVSVVEAMAAGDNIVYSSLNSIALKEIVADTGTPIAELNPELYAEEIINSLNNRKIPNQAAIERVKEMFDIRKKAEQWIAILRQEKQLMGTRLLSI